MTLCPMKASKRTKMPGEVEKIIDVEEFGPCDGADCAWFILDTKTCAMASFAYSLDNIMRFLGGISVELDNIDQNTRP